mmetsp:Transcript_13725/g.28699  ORF Transcript_13725/g.28699 Transcript_13725/m.28699 type:complete len:200 (-) Transcript_13725:295-894(-)
MLDDPLCGPEFVHGFIDVLGRVGDALHTVLLDALVDVFHEFCEQGPPLDILAQHLPIRACETHEQLLLLSIWSTAGAIKKGTCVLLCFRLWGARYRAERLQCVRQANLAVPAKWRLAITIGTSVDSLSGNPAQTRQRALHPLAAAYGVCQARDARSNLFEAEALDDVPRKFLSSGGACEEVVDEREVSLVLQLGLVHAL